MFQKGIQLIFGYGINANNVMKVARKINPAGDRLDSNEDFDESMDIPEQLKIKEKTGAPLRSSTWSCFIHKFLPSVYSKVFYERLC